MEVNGIRILYPLEKKLRLFPAVKLAEKAVNYFKARGFEEEVLMTHVKFKNLSGEVIVPQDLFEKAEEGITLLLDASYWIFNINLQQDRERLDVSIINCFNESEIPPKHSYLLDICLEDRFCEVTQERYLRYEKYKKDIFNIEKFETGDNQIVNPFDYDIPTIEEIIK